MINHIDKIIPIKNIIGPSSKNKITPIKKTKIIIYLFSFFNKFSTVFLFQFVFIIIPLTKMAGIIIGKKTKLKYGAPTDISLPVITSTKSGHNVPNKIVTVEAHKNTLFSKSPPSLERRLSFTSLSILSYFMTYKINDAPVIKNKKLNIYIPLAGSDANA